MKRIFSLLLALSFVFVSAPASAAVTLEVNTAGLLSGLAAVSAEALGGGAYKVDVENLTAEQQRVYVELYMKDSAGKTLNMARTVADMGAGETRMVNFSMSISTAAVTKAVVEVFGGDDLGVYNLYVSGDGSDSNPGTFTQPFKTLTKARDAVRTVKTQHKGKIRVNLRGGVYNLSDTVVFTDADSGKSGSEITYRAFADETVRITGGKEYPGTAFTQHDAGKNIYVAGLTPSDIFSFKDGNPNFMRVEFNAEALTLARYPNKDADPPHMTVAKGDAIANSDNKKMKISAELAARAASYANGGNGAWLAGTPSWEWEYRFDKINAINATDDPPWLQLVNNFGSFKPGDGGARNYWFLYNQIEELDAPGEFFIDYAANKLYLIPPAGMTMPTATITLGNFGSTAGQDWRKELGDYYGDTANTGVPFDDDDYYYTKALIKIDGGKFLHFEDIDFTTARDCFVYIGKGSEDNVLRGCTFSSSSGVAIQDAGMVRVRGYRNIVENCEFYDLGSAALTLNGGDRYSLMRSGNRVQNNKFHDFGLLTRKAGIWLKGCGDIVANNKIYNAPSSASAMSGNYNIYEYNEFYNCMTDGLHDFGILYGGADISARGNEIRYNYFHDNPHGIANVYLDDYLSETFVYGNLFDGVANYNGQAEAYAMMNNGGSYNQFYDNIVINADKVGGGLNKRQEDRWHHSIIDNGSGGYRTHFADSGSQFLDRLGRYYDVSGYYEWLRENGTEGQKAVYASTEKYPGKYKVPDNAAIWAEAFPGIAAQLNQISGELVSGNRHPPINTTFERNVYANLAVFNPLYSSAPQFNASGKRGAFYFQVSAAGTYSETDTKASTVGDIFVNYAGGDLRIKSSLINSMPPGFKPFDISKIN